MIGGVVLLGAVAVFGLGLGDQFVERVSEGVQFQDQANQMRLAEFRNAITIIRRYPAFGVGFGAGPELGLITGVSSIYLAMAERIGLLGLGTFLGLMAAFMIQTLARLRTLDEERQSWLLGIQSGVLAALAVGLLDHYYFNIEFSHMVALFWGLIGFGVAILYLPKRWHSIVAFKRHRKRRNIDRWSVKLLLRNHSMNCAGSPIRRSRRMDSVLRMSSTGSSKASVKASRPVVYRTTIFVSDGPDATPRRLTQSRGADDWMPRWSPDGQSLAFLSTRDGNKAHLFRAEFGRWRGATDHALGAAVRGRQAIRLASGRGCLLPGIAGT